MMLGTAASRSISEVSGRRQARGAYSVMKSAAPMATGTANTSATTAISTVSTMTAPIPNC